MKISVTVAALDAVDVGALWAINEASTPGVGALSASELARLIRLPGAACHVAADATGAPLGFLLLMPPEADYHSPNYRWFMERWRRGEGRRFAYVDRIAVGAEARGAGVGAALYAAVFAEPPIGAEVVCCEVNTSPPNPGSLRFHSRLGFQTVGAAAHLPGEKEVAYLEKPLAK